MSQAKLSQSKDQKTKQATLFGFFGAPKSGPPPRPSSTQPIKSARPSTAASAPALNPGTSSSPSSSYLQTPSSATGSSPLNGHANGIQRKAHQNLREVERSGSPLKKGSAPVVAEEDDLSPPPEITNTGTRKELGQDDADMEDDEMPIRTGRRGKRKVIYAESEDEEDEMPSKPQTNGRRSRKSIKASSDDEDFFFDETDDAVFAAVGEEFEAGQPSSPSPSITSEPPVRSKKSTFQPPPRKAPPPSSSRPLSSALPKRPGPHPLPDDLFSQTGSGSNPPSTRFLTQAERKKVELAFENKNKDSVFPFLINPLDAQGRSQDDPEYDPRTLKISKKELDDLKAFERQFWTIKKDHFDTVLFFQKGKFFELYEQDAAIGHQEFDLKLTERVRMKMVGVPEQSFDFWAAKFLAAGHKVGKVEQAETAIGAEMRRDAEDKGKSKGKKKTTFVDDDDDEGGGASNKADEKIVRRELRQVFTNGTIVDGQYLTSDEANHCVAIKEYQPNPDSPSSFGICVLDASTGEFKLTAFDDDICRTRLETMFRQIRPKELVHAKGNLTVETMRALRNMLPMSTLWQPFRPEIEFYNADKTLIELSKLFETEDDDPGSNKPQLPEAIEEMIDNPLAMESLGGMLFYLQSLNLDKDLITQRNFNIYDPIKEGRCLILDGQTLGHMEVLVNNEGGQDGTLLELLQLCTTPFGKRLFRYWLTHPLRDIQAINDRLDAIENLMQYTAFTGKFTQETKNLPDLERLLSRIHAGAVKQMDFTRVVEAFGEIMRLVDDLLVQAESFDHKSIAGLLRQMPDLKAIHAHIKTRYREDRKGENNKQTMELVPEEGADIECDEANQEVSAIEKELNSVLKSYQREIGNKSMVYWHSTLGGKDIFQIQVSTATANSGDIPKNWVKQSETKNYKRYYTPKTLPLVRKIQEARETQTAAKRTFYGRLLMEFDKDRNIWLAAVKIIAELDCLVSLAKASSNMDEPKCRPTFIDSPESFIQFEELRHPSMCLRADFIPNNVSLGGVGEDGNKQARQILLTGPNMAGKSTLLRMTAAGIILAQMGCYVPARSAVLAPVDKIQTRMGAYDNMFASASTFKVELDECSKILREAGPRSFVILDELGRGTSTYDGMAIAGAVLHHLATHTLPLGFFATHYGSLTDDYSYHPNVRKMHMQTHVDDEEMQVVFLYKLIPGVAESSHGTHVARMAGVPTDVVLRADQVSAEFFESFKEKLANRRQSDLPLMAVADCAYLMKLVNEHGKLVDGGDIQMTASEHHQGTGKDGNAGGGGEKASVKMILNNMLGIVNSY